MDFLNLDVENDLTYNECKSIYDNWELGKRFVNALPNYAMSAGREIQIGDAPFEVIKQFKDTCNKYKLDYNIKKCVKVARIYGMSGLFIASDKPTYDNLSDKDLKDYTIRFNVIDPLCCGSLNFSQNPLSLKYQRPLTCKLNGNDIGDRRFILCINDMPLHIDFETSTFNFAGKSVFKNMKKLIILWNNLFSSLDRIALKASSMIVTGDTNGGIFSGLKIESTQKSLQLLENLRNGAAWLPKGASIEFFNLNGSVEVTSMIESILSAFCIAISDTPKSILLDEKMSNGLNEGEADLKSSIMAVDSFRNEILTPLYIYADAFMQKIAFNDEFIKDIILKYGEMYQNMSINEIRNKWIQDFNFTWENIQKPNPDELAKEKSTLIDNLLKIKDLGVDTSSLIEELNASKYFTHEFIKNDDIDDFNFDENDEVLNQAYEKWNKQNEL